MKNLLLLFFLAFFSNANSQTSIYSSNRTNYNPPLSSSNHELDMKVLQRMQDSYDKNYKLTLDKINKIEKLIYKLYLKNNESFTEKQIEYLKAVYKYINDIKKTNLTSNSETQYILKNLDRIEDAIIDFF